MIQICELCGSEYKAYSKVSKYCGDECRREVSRGRYHDALKVGAGYEAYRKKKQTFNLMPRIEVRESKKHEPIKVPDLAFTRYPETRNMMVVGFKREQEREAWRE